MLSCGCELNTFGATDGVTEDDSSLSATQTTSANSGQSPSTSGESTNSSSSSGAATSDMSTSASASGGQSNDPQPASGLYSDCDDVNNLCPDLCLLFQDANMNVLDAISNE